MAVILRATNNPKVTDEFHYYMYHGACSRKGVEYPSDPCHSFDDKDLDPIDLRLNIYKLNEIIIPSTSLFMTGKFLSLFNGNINIKIRTTNIIQVIDLPYSKGDRSYISKLFGGTYGGYSDTGIFNSLQRFDSKKSPPAFYEIVTRRVRDFSQDKKLINKKFIFKDAHNSVQSIEFDVGILEKCLILSCFHGLVIHESIYDKIVDYLDPDYYYIASLAKN